MSDETANDKRAEDVDEMVATPGGYRHRSRVHRIDRGNVLDCAGGHHRQLDPAGRVVADYGVIPTRPGSEPLMPANVHVPPELARASALGSGWITYTSLGSSEEPFSGLQATWQVPCAPRTRSGQLIYLFPAFQNTGMILQPVLQWGASPAGGGEYWAVASWYADGKDGFAFHTSAVRVEVGDTLVGGITTVAESDLDNPWYFPGAVTATCLFGGIDHTTLWIQHIPGFNWASVTLEAYGITRCSDYPHTNTTRFWNISVEPGAATTGLSWRSVDPVTDCGQSAKVDSNSTSGGEVTLWYRPSSRFPPGTQVGVVSRSKDKLDIFAVNTDLQVVTAAWEPDIPGWRGWWQVACGQAASRAPVTAVSRSKDKLDVFAVDTDGHVVTAAWEPDIPGWRGWWQVLTGAAANGAYVSCVSRSSDKLDIFVVGIDNHVWTAAWEPDAGWRGWWQIGDISVPDGAPVHAVSRSKDKLDIFVAGNDFQVWTAAWEPDTNWGEWRRIGDLSVPAGTPVHAVSPSEDKLDIFVTDAVGIIKTAAWKPDIYSWRDWSEISGGQAPARAPVTAVSRSKDKLDIFVVDEDAVKSAAWEPDAGWGDWKWLLPGG
jgi:hypothetical protein